MTYVKTTWNDRIVANPMTFRFINNGDGTTTLQLAEGAITQAGTPVNSLNMNHLETQYDQAMADIATQYLKLVGGSLTGELNIASGADVTPFSLKNDNGTLIFQNDTTDNSIQSLIANGTASRNFSIEGLNGANLSLLNLKADTTAIASALTVGTTLNVTGASTFTTATGATINATANLQEAGVNLSTKYAPIVAPVFNSGAGTVIATFKNNNGQYYALSTASVNVFQSVDSTGVTSKAFKIEGYSGASLPTLTLNADNTTLTGTLSINQGGTQSILASNAFTHFTFKKATMKSWTLQHSASGDLVFYPSTLADGTTWDTTKAVTLSSATGIVNSVAGFAENGTNLYMKYASINSPTFNGTLTAPTINATTALQINGTSINTIYAPIASPTFTGTITAPTINATSNLQENGTNLTSKYVQLNASSTIIGNVTLNGGQLVVTNDTPLYLKSNTNDGQVRFTTTASNNWIQSGTLANAPKNLTISGMNASTMTNVDILANTVKISGNVVQTSGHIQSGSVSITPVANTPTSTHVTFPVAYLTAPVVTVSAVSGVPFTQVQGVSVSNITATGCDVYLTRNNTNATTVNWLAQGTI